MNPYIIIQTVFIVYFDSYIQLFKYDLKTTFIIFDIMFSDFIRS